MRYIPSNLKVLKNKIKLLKKYTDIISEGEGEILDSPTITKLQEYLAKALGYHAWAELVRVSEQQTNVTKYAHITSLRETAQRLAQLLGQSDLVAAGLLLRVGITPKLNRADGFDWLSFREITLFVDLVTARLHETTDRHEISLILKYLRSVELQLNLHLDEHAMLWPYVAENRNLFTPEETDHPSRYANNKCLDSIAKSLPQTGIFLLSGTTGSLRSRSAVSLMNALNMKNRNLLPITRSLTATAVKSDHTGVVFIDEVSNHDELSDLGEMIRNNLVIIKIAASSGEESRRFFLKLLTAAIGQTSADALLDAALAGGLHHSFSGAAQTLLQWWENDGFTYNNSLTYRATRTWHLNPEGLACTNQHRYLEWLTRWHIANYDPQATNPARDAERDLESEITTSFLKNAVPPSDLRGSRLRSKVQELIIEFRKPPATVIELNF